MPPARDADDLTRCDAAERDVDDLAAGRVPDVEPAPAAGRARPVPRVGKMGAARARARFGMR